MPLVEIYTRSGRSPDQLEAFRNGIHRALVTQAAVPADDLFQVVNEVPAGYLAAHATYGGVERSEDVLFVKITLNAGRTEDVKKNLYAAMARHLEAAGLRSDDLLIVLVEVVKENWSFGGGRMTYG